MSLSVDQLAALEKASVPLAYFAFFDFLSGDVRVCNFDRTFSWGGHDWLGVRNLSAISKVSEGDSIESSAVNFTLNISDQSVLALAVGPVEEYRGRSATLWMCPLDENHRLIDEPEICWTGVMDTMGLGVSDDGGSVTLKCETAAFGLKRIPAMRMNAAQHKKKYPHDTGFDFLNDIISQGKVWLSRRFLKV